MPAVLWAAVALLLSALLSIVVAMRELRRRNYTLGGFALLCLAFCVIALVQPFPTHAVRVELPVKASD